MPRLHKKTPSPLDLTGEVPHGDLKHITAINAETNEPLGTFAIDAHSGAEDIARTIVQIALDLP